MATPRLLINFRNIFFANLTAWNNGVLPIRRNIQGNRTRRTIPIGLTLPDGLEFQWNAPGLPTSRQVTSQRLSDLQYDLDARTVYGTNVQMRHETLGFRNITFKANYTRTYEVSHFMGIMVSEQIRFSTLQDSTRDPRYAIHNRDLAWKEYFFFFYDNFKENNDRIYNKWDNTAGPWRNTMLLNNQRVDVNVPVVHQTFLGR